MRRRDLPAVPSSGRSRPCPQGQAHRLHLFKCQQLEQDGEADLQPWALWEDPLSKISMTLLRS